MSSVTSTSAGLLWRTVVCTNVPRRTEWGAQRTLHPLGFMVMSLCTLMDFVVPTSDIYVNSSLQEAQVLQAVVCSSQAVACSCRPHCVPPYSSVFLQAVVCSSQAVACSCRPHCVPAYSSVFLQAVVCSTQAVACSCLLPDRSVLYQAVTCSSRPKCVPSMP